MKLNRLLATMALVCASSAAVAQSFLPSTIASDAALVWGDYVVNGVPSSGKKKPAKPDIRRLMTAVGVGVNAALGAGAGGTLGYLNATAMNADLAHAAGAIASVFNDPIAANNGVYIKTGASGSGSWMQVSSHLYGLLPNVQVAPITLLDSGATPYVTVTGDPATPTLNFFLPRSAVGSLTWRGAWSSATAYAANDVVSSGGVSYIAVAASTNQAPPNVAYWNPMTGAVSVANPYANDFNLAAGKTFQINGVAALRMAGVCDGATLDDSNLSTALSAAASGGVRKVMLPPGNCLISSTLHIPNGVVIDAQGGGSNIDNEPAATKLVWRGSSGGTMVTVGRLGAGVNDNGSAIGHVALDGGGVAGVGLIVQDINHSDFPSVDCSGVISYCVWLKNTTSGGSQFPTGFLNFDDLHIDVLSPKFQGSAGDTTSGSPVINNLSSVFGFTVGNPIAGAGVPSGATISSISGSGPYSVTMSANATATASGVYIYTTITNPNAIGVMCDGSGSGAEGVTLLKFKRPRVNHYNGAAFGTGFRCDGVDMDSPYAWRPTGGVGFGFATQSTDPAQVISGWHISHSLFTGGYYIGVPGSAHGWVIDQLYDSTDTYATPANHIYGPGKFDVSVPTSFSSKMRGPARLGGYLDAARQDAMFFTRFDSANNVLMTAQGSWNSTGLVQDSGQPGGGVNIVSSNSAGATASIAEGAFGTGPSISLNPQAVFTVSPAGVGTTTAFRVGFFNDMADPPNNAHYIEGPAAAGAHYFCVTAASGVRTRVDMGIGIPASPISLRIDADAAGRVTCSYRAAASANWAVGATITSNVNYGALTVGAWVKSYDANFHTLTISDVRRAFDLEN